MLFAQSARGNVMVVSNLCIALASLSMSESSPNDSLAVCQEVQVDQKLTSFNKSSQVKQMLSHFLVPVSTHYRQIPILTMSRTN
jgi:hypothetical protein